MANREHTFQQNVHEQAPGKISTAKHTINSLHDFAQQPRARIERNVIDMLQFLWKRFRFW